MNLDLGSKIKLLREEREFSQSELCGDIIDRTTLSKIENGKMLPSIVQLQYIADKLNVSLSSFFITTESEYHNYSITGNYNTNIMSDMFISERYFDLIKFPENYPKEFKNINDINKYFFIGMSYIKTCRYEASIKPLKTFINNYLKSPENIQKQSVLNFAQAANSLYSFEYRKNMNPGKYINGLINAQKNLIKYNSTQSYIFFLIVRNVADMYNETMQFNKTIDMLEGFLNGDLTVFYMDIIPHIYLELSIAYLHTDDPEKAYLESKKGVTLMSYVKSKELTAIFYLSYIYILRHCKKYDEAFEIIEECKKRFFSDKDIYVRFTMLEMTLQFNLKEFDKFHELSRNLRINNSLKLNKLLESCDYYFQFMLGHIHYLCNNFNEAIGCFKSCEEFFIKHNYTFDLVVMYEDLFNMTGDDQYKGKTLKYKSQPVKKLICT